MMKQNPPDVVENFRVSMPLSLDMDDGIGQQQKFRKTAYSLTWCVVMAGGGCGAETAPLLWRATSQRRLGLQQQR